MRYRYLDDFRRGISVFAIFSYGIAVLGTPPLHPHHPLMSPSNVMPSTIVVTLITCGSISRSNDTAVNQIKHTTWRLNYEWCSCSSSHKQARKQSSEASLIKYVDFSILSVERKFSQS